MSKVMEYQDLVTTPATQKVRKEDPNMTQFVSKNGEFLRFPSEVQAKIKVAKFLKKFKPEEWWAQKVSRFRLGGEDYFSAYIKRDFSAKHDRSDIAHTSDHEMWLGREVIGIPAMTTDNDEHSDTHGQRVSLVMTCQLADGTTTELPVLEKQGYYSYLKVTKNSIEMMKKMCGMTSDDLDTEYVFTLQKGGRNVGADDPDEMWELSCDDKRLEDRHLTRARRKKELTEAKEPTAHAKLK